MSFSSKLCFLVVSLGAQAVLAQSTYTDEATGLLASEPDTKIDSAPSEYSNQSTAVFKFSVSSSDGYGETECSIDSAAYSTCYSPYSRRNLTDKKYEFCVRGIDRAGTKDSTPACHQWTIDTKLPEIVITSPTANAGVFTKNPEIKGTTSEPSCEVHVFVGDKDMGSVTSDASGQWSFSSPLNLSNGSQSLSATAKDRAGNVSARSAITSVNVSTDPPKTTIVEHPEQNHRSRNAVFEFASSTGATQFECQLDKASSYTPCDEVWLVKKLEPGAHTLRVRAKDSAGNVDPAPVEFSWTVDPSLAPTACVPGPSGAVPGTEPQAGCASAGGNPTMALGLLGGVLLVLTARRRRSS